MFQWIKKISIPDFFTLANGMIGFLAILYIFDRTTTSFLIASALLLVAMLMDGLDGALARKFGSKHQVGHYLDSISDTISFCFAPALLVYETYYDLSKGSALFNFENAIVIITAMMMAFFGLLRLIKFSKKGFHYSNFRGIATPAMTLAAILLCVLFGSEGLVGKQPIVTLPAMMLISVLMLSDIEYPKIRGKLTAYGAVMGAFSIVGVVLRPWAGTPDTLWFELSRFSTVFALAILVLYMSAGPLIVRRLGLSEKVRPSK